MNQIITFLFLTLILTFSNNNLNGQSSTNSDEYIQKAEEFKNLLNPDSALIYYEKAAIEYIKIGNIEKLVHSMNQIGVILTRQDKYEHAKSYLKEALSIGLPSLDTNSLVIASTYIGLGVIFSAEENYTQSLIYRHKALSIRLLKLGEYHTDVATSYGNIGNVYLNSKDYDKSIEAHLKAKAIREQLLGSESVEVIQSYVGLGNAYREIKEYNTSLQYFEQALQNKIKQRGLGHTDLVKFYNYIRDVYYLMGNNEQGDIYKTKSEEILNK